LLGGIERSVGSMVKLGGEAAIVLHRPAERPIHSG